jgi:hypothetical protein
LVSGPGAAGPGWQAQQRLCHQYRHRRHGRRYHYTGQKLREQERLEQQQEQQRQQQQQQSRFECLRQSRHLSGRQGWTATAAATSAATAAAAAAAAAAVPAAIAGVEAVAPQGRLPWVVRVRPAAAAAAVAAALPLPLSSPLLPSASFSVLLSLPLLLLLPQQHRCFSSSTSHGSEYVCVFFLSVLSLLLIFFLFFFIYWGGLSFCWLYTVVILFFGRGNKEKSEEWSNAKPGKANSFSKNFFYFFSML